MVSQKLIELLKNLHLFLQYSHYIAKHFTFGVYKFCKLNETLSIHNSYQELRIFARWSPHKIFQDKYIPPDKKFCGNITSTYFCKFDTIPTLGLC